MSNRRPRPERAYETKELDGLDRRIIAELQVDARLSLAELGRRVSASLAVEVEVVPALDRTSSGKERLVISSLPR